MSSAGDLDRVWLRPAAANGLGQGCERYLLANAHTIDSRTHLTMIAGTAFNVERTSFSGSTIGVERIAVGYLVVLVAGKLPAGAHAENASARLDAFAAR